jgi:hypothetical protein
MYEIEAMVTRTGPTVLKLTADWPVDWLRASGIRTIEIQRELIHGEFLELPSVLTEGADLDGNRVNWPKLWVGSRVVVRCFSPGETEPNTAVSSLPFHSVELLETDAATTAPRRLAIRLLFPSRKTGEK